MIRARRIEQEAAD